MKITFSILHVPNWAKQVAGAVLLLLCESMSLLNAAPPSEGPEKRGFFALEARRFDDAFTLFTEAFRSAELQNDTNRIANMQFYRALTKQRQALQAKDGAERGRLYDEAIQYYNHAIGIRANFSAALNNLGRIYADRGDVAQALVLSKRVLELNDARQGYYAENHADLLLRTGQWKEACRFFALAAWAQPSNETVRGKLVRECLRSGPDLLGQYLWDFVEHGMVLQVEEIALDVLGNERLGPNHKEELLSIVAVCLSRQYYLPAAFQETASGKRLTAFRADPAVGQGVSELSDLHGRRIDRKDLQWWTDRTVPLRPDMPDSAPQAALGKLISSLGERLIRAKETNAAERYLILATELHSGPPDPNAIIRLAELYAERRQYAKLKALAEKHQRDLFVGKGEAYNQSDLRKMYAFHTALGVIYAHTERFGDSSSPQSATFQLEHALRIADQIKDHSDIRSPATAIDLLAYAYEKTKQEAKGIELRLTQSEAYLKQGNPEAARIILGPVANEDAPSGWPEGSQMRLLKVKTEIGLASMKRSDASYEETVTAVHIAESNSSSISESDRLALQKRVTELIEQEQEKEFNPNRLYLLPQKDDLQGVKEVEIRGNKGKIALEKQGQTVEVPFVIRNSPAIQRSQTTRRFVKP